MAELLDLRTLFLNTMVLCLVFFFGMVFFAKAHRSFTGIYAIAIGFLCTFTTFLLYSLRDFVPEFFSIILPNSMVVMALAFVHYGLARFHGNTSDLIKLFHFLMLLIIFYLSLRYTYVAPSVNSRIVIISIVLGLQMLYSAVSLFQLKEGASHKSIRLLAVFFTLYAGFLFFRSYYTTSESPILEFVDAGLVHSITVMLFQFYVLLAGLTVIWSVSNALEQDLINQATLDPLTQVYNRRALDNIIALECSRAHRNDYGLSILMLDIDHFQDINDRYGHKAGDDVIVEFANILSQETRLHDAVVRYGGEEFLLLLPEADATQADVIAEKLRSIIEVHPFEISAGLKASLTVSIGIATASCSELSEDVIDRAHEALYQAKKEGRNRVVKA